MKPLIAAVLLLAPMTLAAQTNDKAEQSFCQFTMEQAMAQRDLLRTPSLTTGPVDPSGGTPPQMVVGVTSSIGDIRKAGRTMDVGRATCALYTTATEAQMKIFYALPSLEKEVLKHRLVLIEDATTRLDGLITDNMKSVEAQDLTAPALYSLQNAKVRLDTSRTAALTGLASPYVPPTSDRPLRDLVSEKLAAEGKFAESSARLAKQSAWDIKLSGGAHEQLGSTTTAPGTTTTNRGPYAEFNFTYNFGRKAVDKHLDKSVTAYNEWKSTQFDDVAQQAYVLRRQIEDTITAQQQELLVLHKHDAEIETSLRSLDGVDTASALAFRNELIADQTVLRVDIEDIEFRVGQLKTYVVENF